MEIQLSNHVEGMEQDDLSFGDLTESEGEGPGRFPTSSFNLERERDDWLDNKTIVEVIDYDALLSDTNDVLTAVGISSKYIKSIEELARVASSMFVAIFESMFHKRLDGIVRFPKTLREYAHNSQCKYSF